MARTVLSRGLAVTTLLAIAACNSILGNHEHPLEIRASAGSTANSGASGLSNAGSSGKGNGSSGEGEMTDGAGDSAGGSAGLANSSAGTAGSMTAGGAATSGAGGASPAGGAGGTLNVGGTLSGGAGGVITSAGTAGVIAGGGAGGTNSSGGGGAGGTNSGGSGGSGGSGAVSTGCGKMPTISSDMYNNGTPIPITAASLARRYILSVPAGYSNTKPYRLVIAWHQRDGNDKQEYANKYYHLQPLDTNDTTIFVAPNGQLNGAGCMGTGSGESGCAWPNANDTDVALGDAIVKQIEDNFCIDTKRIFGIGWSVGGGMAAVTACKRPLGAVNGYIRAIAVYSGGQYSGACTPSMPVAYYASHGTADSVIGYSNGLTLAQLFAAANGCTWTTPTAVMSGNHACTDLTGCNSGYPERFCSFNGDHTADPSDGGTSWEYANTWNFLSQF